MNLSIHPFKIGISVSLSKNFFLKIFKDKVDVDNIVVIQIPNSSLRDTYLEEFLKHLINKLNLVLSIV